LDGGTECGARRIEIIHDAAIAHEGQLVAVLRQDHSKHMDERIIVAIDFLALALARHGGPPRA
jgi:hypothetical protein